MVNDWSNTAHSSIFTNSINCQGAKVNGVPYPYTSACWPCHTVGYDASTTVQNGGFNQLMAQLKLGCSDNSAARQLCRDASSAAERFQHPMRELPRSRLDARRLRRRSAANHGQSPRLAPVYNATPKRRTI